MRRVISGGGVVDSLSDFGEFPMLSRIFQLQTTSCKLRIPPNGAFVHLSLLDSLTNVRNDASVGTSQLTCVCSG